ncbi:MAG TPA: hypothetical protein VKG45_00675 [Actinomycetes bacterium]|nr:hypothetical protein [Actinomycetes bacterium]
MLVGVLAGVAVVVVVVGLLVLGGLGRTADNSGGGSTAPAATASSGPMIRGAGYAFGVPQQWQQVTDRIRGSGAIPADIELLAAVAPADPLAGEARKEAVVIVTRKPCPCGDLDSFPDYMLQQAGTAAAVRPLGAPRHITLGGEDAIAFDYTQGVVHRRMSASIHDGTVYVVTFEAKGSSFAGSEAGARHVLDTWQWR